MSYVKLFEVELAAKLIKQGCPGDVGALVQWVSEKVLESYKNGLVTGRKRAAAGNGKKSEKDSSAQPQ